MNTASNVQLPSYRVLNAFGFLAALAALIFAVVYLERTLYLDPCPLCIIDRAFLVAIGTVFLLAALHNPARPGQRVYGVINLLFSSGGLATAGRHIWLQNLPEDQVPECGASLSYMLETLPLADTFRNVLQGSGECAAVQWTFLGLSIAEQTVLLFAALLLLVLVQVVRR